jgi:hypothetical protein
MIVCCLDMVSDPVTNMPIVTGACSIEFFVAAKDPFRAAPGNKIPFPWPYQFSRPSSQARDLLESLENEYKKVLQDNNIQLRHTAVMSLCRKGEHDPPRDTLLIFSEDIDTKNWKGAATEIQEIIDRASRKLNGNPTIRVEIRNEDMMYKDVSSIIKPQTVEQRACMEIEDAVQEQVKRSCPGDWTFIGYFMRGKTGQMETSRKLTLIVGIKPRKRSLWGVVEEQIDEAVKSVKKSDIDIHIELFPSRVHLLFDPTKPASKEMLPVGAEMQWNTELAPRNGASIAPRGACNAGSLGAWVSFRGPDGAKKLCFLTCHHVISTGDPGNQTTNDKFGICLNGKTATTSIVVDYPAPFDTAETRKVLGSMISQGDDHGGSMKRSLEMIDTHIRNGGIGSVMHSSGIYRENDENRRMDWALVQCHDPSTFGKNIPPPLGGFTTTQLGIQQPYVVRPDEIIQKSGKPVEGEWVVKIGRTTGVTFGYVNGMKTLVHWENERETSEIVVVGRTEFADRGDSGSMVVSLKKEWVGMLIGKMSAESWGIMTSVSELREDINKGTGGSISLA